MDTSVLVRSTWHFHSNIIRSNESWYERGGVWHRYCCQRRDWSHFWSIRQRSSEGVEDILWGRNLVCQIAKSFLTLLLSTDNFLNVASCGKQRHSHPQISALAPPSKLSTGQVGIPTWFYQKWDTSLLEVAMGNTDFGLMEFSKKGSRVVVLVLRTNLSRINRDG